MLTFHLIKFFCATSALEKIHAWVCCVCCQITVGPVWIISDKMEIVTRGGAKQLQEYPVWLHICISSLARSRLSNVKSQANLVVVYVCTMPSCMFVSHKRNLFVYPHPTEIIGFSGCTCIYAFFCSICTYTYGTKKVFIPPHLTDIIEVKECR